MAPRPRRLSSRELLSVLRSLGFEVITTRGSHAKLRRTGPRGEQQSLTIPLHREVAPGTLKAVDVDGQAILLANVGGELLAVSNRCGESPLPLQFSALHGNELRCSWHGCRYDLRSGRRLDGPERLAVFPVAVEGGEVRLAIGAEPVARG